MMSVWLNGILRTQKACYVVDDGDLRFCRPLAFVREQDTKQFGEPGEGVCEFCLLTPFSYRKEAARHQRDVPGLLQRAQGACTHQDAAQESGGAVPAHVRLHAESYGSINGTLPLLTRVYCCVI